ncbi:MAG TPA: hypothetical protein VFF06_00570 [Polyangia bacterium]|nr:hypothetical protein [Polyangia bacterium]
MPLVLALLAVLAAGCSDSSPSPAIDLSTSADLSTSGGNPDLAGGGGKMFGDLCTTPGTPGDCAPGLICDQFAMGAVHRCTRTCPNNVCDATCCPAPSAGSCNGKMECKFTM